VEGAVAEMNEFEVPWTLQQQMAQLHALVSHVTLAEGQSRTKSKTLIKTS
jgi:hypothetical protein